MKRATTGDALLIFAPGDARLISRRRQPADERGRISEARVPRFHDAYAAVGGSAELGPWRFTLQRLVEVQGPNYVALQADIGSSDVAVGVALGVGGGATAMAPSTRGSTASSWTASPSTANSAATASAFTFSGNAKERVNEP